MTRARRTGRSTSSSSAAAGRRDAEATVRRAVEEAAQAVKQSCAGRGLAVLLTDDAAIRRLNATWRGIDKPTNVLSFPAAAE